jgi:dihydrofolate synthase/folylpolyglutamate synthase
MWNLDNMRHLMAELGQVQDKLKVIHVAGTNGKGSVCTILSAILTKEGYKTGCYRSPWVFQREEMFQINGKNISVGSYQTLLLQVENACERLLAKGFPQASEFEMDTALAFLWFFQEQCDIVILETGLGGTDDATNVVTAPLCSVITSISRDHIDFLGEDLVGIARAKAGIIKEGRSVVLAKPSAELLQVIESICEEKHANLFLADPKEASKIRYEDGCLVFEHKRFGEIRTSLLGLYQVENITCALWVLECLAGEGIKVNQENIGTILMDLQWQGRFELMQKNPLVIRDGAHNEAAAIKLKETLELGFQNRKIILIIGGLADKEYEKIVKILAPLAWKIITITPNNPRALHGEALALAAKEFHEHVRFLENKKEALQLAVSEAKGEKNGMVLVCGSLSYLKDMA